MMARLDLGTTIFALATGAGRAAIAVVRVSGTGTAEAMRALIGDRLPAPRRASVRQLCDANGTVLDQAMVLWLPGPESYTGEDSAELHLHAGAAVLDGVTAALVAAGARPAEPGEFTRRAFLHGKMALIEAEAVADLIAAETRAQRSQALRQMDGALTRVFDDWAARLRHLLAEQEALIDFPDDTNEAAADDSAVRILIGLIETHLCDERRGERLREGLQFVVSGPPNVGKSSLINALSGKNVSIVAPLPGTTRDVIEVRCVFGGVPVTLLDTAGLRDSDDPVEAEGIRRARARRADADLVLAVAEASTEETPAPSAGRVIMIATKTDLAPAPSGRLGVSIVTGAGLEALREVLDEQAHALTQGGGTAPLTRERHRAACLAAAAHLRAAVTAPAPELRAEDLRLAMMALGRVTGRIGVEDILDSVFSQFCIGK